MEPGEITLTVPSVNTEWSVLRMNDCDGRFNKQIQSNDPWPTVAYLNSNQEI